MDRYAPTTAPTAQSADPGAAGPRHAAINSLKASAEYQRLLADMAEHIHDLAGVPLNWSGSAQVVDHIEGRLHEALGKLPALRKAAQAAEHAANAHRFF